MTRRGHARTGFFPAAWAMNMSSGLKHRTAGVTDEERELPEKRERRLVLALCVLTDGLILLFALSIATITRAHTLLYLDSLGALYRDQLVCVGLYLLGISLANAYNPLRITDRFDSVYFACAGVAVTAAVTVLVSRLIPRGTIAISGRELILGPVLGALALVLWRYYLGGLAARFASLHRYFLVFGSEPEGRRVANAITASAHVRPDARYCTQEEFEAWVKREETGAADASFRSRSAIICSAGLNRDTSVHLLDFCEKNFGRTFLYPSLQDIRLFSQIRLLAIAGIPLIEVSNRQLFAPYVRIKRLIDVGCALAGLLAALPICLATAAAIKLTSPGPLFYTQERVGRNGRRFKLYKFRSMVADAEAHTGPVWASANDSRVTPVGGFIRKHRIDEIPQLLNVLKGDMSLVGPRPERPHFHREFCAKWPMFEKRLAVRPGVTSLSHVLGSYDSEPEDRLRYDLMYISSCSMLTDFKILAATVRVVLGAKGAQ